VTKARAKQPGQANMMRVIALFYSILFFFGIAYGYYLLLAKVNLIAAVIAGGFMAGFAWSLARFIGYSEEGIRSNVPLFFILLLISALGIFNNLMYNFEGRRVLAETVAESQNRFRALQSHAERVLETENILKREKDIRNTEEALYSEILNPVNCGQGPEARKQLARLQAQLPDFVPLSPGRRDCTQNDEIVADYKRRVNELIIRAPWYNADLRTVAKDAERARAELDAIKQNSKSGFAIATVAQFLPQLEQFNDRYKRLYDMATRQKADAALPTELSLDGLANLGDWSRILNTLIGRIGYLATWIFLALAVLADWGMVYCFGRLRENGPRKRAAQGNIGMAW
jgi:hypothetical protein